jgi:two-component system, chemotaxis family, protein-glutamate methylesterase/glutaminase
VSDLRVTPRLRVLVVDDSSFVRRILKLILAQTDDIQVIGEAADGEEALEQIARLRPDVVTLDLDMPKLTGMEVLRRLRPQDDVPVVLVTGLPEMLLGADEEVERLGVAGIVNKAFSDSPMDLSLFSEELLASLRNTVVLEKSRPT